MSLKLLLASLRKGFSGSIVNVMIEVVHACVEAFDDVEARHDRETAALKELCGRLEDRLNERIEDVRAEAARTVDVVAGAIDRHTSSCVHMGSGGN
jgi:predicted Holliday junction resolvase-like endonuclease